MRRAALALLGACGAPSFCPELDQLDGAGCVARAGAITVDGDAGEWEVAPPPSGCETCKPGDVARVRAARTPDARIALLVEVEGAPPTDAQHSYRISLSPVTGPLYYITLRARANLAPELALTELPITGLPVEQGFGAALEIAVPLAALPFAGGSSITAGLETLTADGWVADLFDAHVDGVLGPRVAGVRGPVITAASPRRS